MEHRPATGALRAGQRHATAAGPGHQGGPGRQGDRGGAIAGIDRGFLMYI